MQRLKHKLIPSVSNAFTIVAYIHFMSKHGSIGSYHHLKDTSVLNRMYIQNVD